jgi:phospholipid/cholesterol/gamma-HCH transport system substrate-binding protein
MPSAAKVSWAQLKVGLMAMVAMMIVGTLIFLLTGGGDLFTPTATIRTFLDDSSAMAPKSQVRLNGILIGTIDRIDLTGEKNPRRVVVVEMKIKKEYLRQIPEDSETTISAANLLGDKFINITKGKSTTPVRDGGELKARQINDIPELMNRAGDLLGSLQVTLGRVDKLLAEVEAGQGNIGKLLKDEELYRRVNDLVAEGQKVIVAVNTGKGLLPRMLHDEAFVEDVRMPIRRIDDLLAGLQRGEGTAGKLIKDPAVYDDARKTIVELRRTIEELNAGKGTAGKLLKDDALYKDVRQLIAKLDQSIDRINSGQGTLGQLVVNPQLYESLNGLTREMQGFVKDVRSNPKKFLRIKLAIF